MEPQTTETLRSMHAIEKPEECFFCYSIFSERKPKVTENHIGCTCRFPIHQRFWERWNIYECPICHSRVEEEEEQDDDEDDEEQVVLEPVREAVPQIEQLRDNELLIIIPYINRRFIFRNNLPNTNLLIFILFIMSWFYSYLLR